MLYLILRHHLDIVQLACKLQVGDEHTKVPKYILDQKEIGDMLSSLDAVFAAMDVQMFNLEGIRLLD
jgi:hypothetical protein